MPQQAPIIIAGSSHQELAEEIAQFLRLPLGKVLLETFPDREIGVQILESVRGRDVFVLQSIAHHPNRYLMELLILVDALKRASARSIVAVLPYYPYARQDRKDKGRSPITARLVADLLEKAGVTRVLAMDLHTEQIQGFFNIPVDNLYARSLLVEKLAAEGLKGSSLVVVSPDVGRDRMARKFADALHAGWALVDKRRLNAQEAKAEAVVGDSVKGKTALIVDDICSTGTTLELAAEVCRKEGAKEVIAVVTHGLFLGKKALKGMDRVIATNTVSPLKEGMKTEKVSVAPLFGRAIDCLISAKSISSLF
jgi:ribose-phosphate pyrophosphokinase